MKLTHQMLDVGCCNGGKTNPGPRQVNMLEHNAEYNYICSQAERIMVRYNVACNALIQKIRGNTLVGRTNTTTTFDPVYGTRASMERGIYVARGLSRRIFFIHDSATDLSGPQCDPRERPPARNGGTDRSAGDVGNFKSCDSSRKAPWKPRPYANIQCSDFWTPSGYRKTEHFTLKTLPN